MPATRCQAFAAAVAILLAGCGSVIPKSLTGTGADYDFRNPGCAPYQDPPREKVGVRYLGSGGVAIQWRGDVILLGPAFSNPGMIRARFLRGRTNVERIHDALMLFDYTDTRAIFAAHSHYDHLGDLPVVGALLPEIPIYVNTSGVNILCGEPELRQRVHALPEQTDIAVGSTMRVRAIRSGHAQQICKWRWLPLCRYAEGEVEEAWTTPLAEHRLNRMRGGQTYAFAIELLHANGRTAYRIYYNDASAETPLGQTAGTFDLAILAIPQWNFVRGYPRDLLLALQPRHVLVSHWDNFFRVDDEKWEFVPSMSNGNAAAFLTIVNDYAGGDAAPLNKVCGVTTTQWTMAVPGSSLLFNPR